ncbi:MAG: aspartate--tRNA(Asn) ligase [archaeon]
MNDIVRTKINQLNNKIGQEVLLKGWVHEVRAQSKIIFLLLRDNSGIIQLVLTADNQMFKSMETITKESVISVKGIVQKSNIKGVEVTEKEIEILVTSFEILSLADSNLPIQVVKGKDVAELGTRLDWRWLDLRKPKNILVFKIWTYMEVAMREFWSKNDFIQIYSPKFMGAPSESGAELFSVDYFGKRAFLAQSPQFYKQMAMASGFEKIFEIGPVFRANPSHTTRHDTEFTMIDMEISYVDSHDDVMKVEEEWINYFIGKIKDKFGAEIKEVFELDVIVPTLPFPRLTMKDVQALVREKGYKGPEDDLDAEGEKLIFEIVKDKYNHEFVFIIDYPYSARPFYHMKKEGNLTRSFDLVWKGVEVTTGAQREHRRDVLEKQAIEKGIRLDLIKDYLNFFKYGCPPHGGFAISPTRFLMLMLGLKNVREVTFLPRDTDRLNP